ncbi:MAG: transglutaminase domain-containing protein [Cyanobacteria bacterium P01_D01_bin.156]
MSNNLETRFLTELRKRQRQQKRQKLLKVVKPLMLVGLGLALAYAVYIAPAIGLLLVGGVAIAGLIYQRRRPNVVWLSKKRLRYCFGFSLLALALVYRANPNLLNAPVGNLYVRLAHNPLPQSETITTNWPWPAEQQLHPAIKTIPADAETSIASVAQYITQSETDPQQQVKAVHDYVIQHLSYDRDVLTTGRRPSQEAENVFVAQKAVCEGYSKLFQALGQAVGLEVAYITGDVRRDLAPIDVIPKLYRAASPQYDWTLHAWNAVKLDDHWQLVDTTWDDSDRKYRSNYLMPPANVMISSHLPTLSAWQLLDQQKNKQTFEQSPLLLPDFFVEGLELVSPGVYTTEVEQVGKIQVKQPLDYQRRVVAFTRKEARDDFSIWDWSTEEEPTEKICDSQLTNNVTEITCELVDTGNYQVFLISLGETAGDWLRIGQLKFHVA